MFFKSQHKTFDLANSKKVGCVLFVAVTACCFIIYIVSSLQNSICVLYANNVVCCCFLRVCLFVVCFLFVCFLLCVFLLCVCCFLFLFCFV